MTILWPNGSTIRPAISSPFGPRRGGAFSTHYGTDFVGYDIVHSVLAGTVTFAGWMNPNAGNTVVISHGDGITEVHMHLETLLVSRGSRIPPGSPLGRMGKTGNATGRCDHLEIRVHGTSVDPVPWITARITSGSPAAQPTGDGQEEEDMYIANCRNGSFYLVIGTKAHALAKGSGARESGIPILNYPDDWAVEQLATVVSGVK